MNSAIFTHESAHKEVENEKIHEYGWNSNRHQRNTYEYIGNAYIDTYRNTYINLLLKFALNQILTGRLSKASIIN